MSVASGEVSAPRASYADIIARVRGVADRAAALIPRAEARANCIPTCPDEVGLDFRRPPASESSTAFPEGGGDV